MELGEQSFPGKKVRLLAAPCLSASPPTHPPASGDVKAVRANLMALDLPGGHRAHCPIGHAASRRAESRASSVTANDARRERHTSRHQVQMHRARASRCSSGANLALILGESRSLCWCKGDHRSLLPWTRTTFDEIAAAAAGRKLVHSPPNWKNAAGRSTHHFFLEIASAV